MKMGGHGSLSQGGIVLWGALLLVGCGSGAHLQQLDSRLDALREQPQGHIDPSPKFEPIATFTYRAQKLRSPFLPPTDQELLAAPDGKHVEPDTGRAKEYLEGFSLDSLAMVGTISRSGIPLEGLVEDPSGRVSRVKPGSHMGKHFGRVVNVSQDRVALVEIVPDGEGGWVERSRNVTLADH